MRGKKRSVVEVIARERAPGSYQFTLRLSCGHIVKQSSARTRKDYTPTVGYCMEFACLSGKAVAA